MALLHTSVWLVLLGALATLGAAFWPANLGGRTTYVTTHGTSMIPRFHAGDLAVVQPVARYRVGDIAAYRSATLHGAIVLHRIVAIDDGHFTFKGDSNDFRDPDHPGTAQLVGKLRLRIPHGGAIRSLLARPIVLFPLLAVIFAGLIPRAKTSRRTRARDRSPAAKRAGRTAVTILLTGALATGGIVLAAVAIWRAPRTVLATTAQPYRETATIGYSGAVPRGAVYPDGRLQTGDPVFTRMVRNITIDLDFARTGPGARDPVRTTSEVIADFSSDTGWHRVLVLSPTRTLIGRHGHASATLDLVALRLIQQAFTNETGLGTPDASLRVTWRLYPGVAVAGPQNANELAPHLDFQLTPVELVPLLRTTSSGAAPASASASKMGSFPVAIERPHTFAVAGFRASDAEARSLAIALVASVVGLTFTLLVAARRRSSAGAAGAVAARYRSFVINVTSLPPAGRRPVVHVHTMRDLTRLAKLHEEFVVHATESGLDRFALFTDAVVYAHDVARPARATAADEELARWALAGLEACAAERRHAPRRRHLSTPPGAERPRPTR